MRTTRPWCVRKGLWICGLVALAAAFAGEAAAQTLNQNMCDPGDPFNIRPTWSPFAGAGFPLIRHTLDLQVHPDAVCNDGSPGVFYLRPSNHANPGGPWTTKWLIFFDGGGSCRGANDCLDTRWCSGGGEIFNRAGKMSSLGAWAAIRSPGGIWNLAPPPPLVNHFNDYNQVLVHYCSSDSWIGSARLQGIAATNGTAYDIQFQGEAIVNAVIETLLAGPTMPDAGPVQDKFQYELPDLDDATEILFGAESAGANGLRHHLDRLHDWLEPLTGAIVRGLLDASFTPAEWDPGIDWSDPFSPGDYADLLARDIEVTVRSFWGADDSALDASCLDPAWEADHLAVGGLHPQICFDTAYVQLNHITTPVFQRMDIDDPLGEQRYFAWHLFPTLPDDYWLAVHDQLGDFTAGTGLEPPGTVPGIQGPNCGKHVAVQTTPGFFRDRASGPTYPTPLPFHDLLVNWLNGVPPGDDTIQIQEDALGAGLYSPSQCF